jgi:hypothetical protein
MKIKGQLHLAFFSHSRPEKGLPFVGSSTFEITLKTIMASGCVQENNLQATTLQSDKTRAKTSIKLLQEKLLTHVPFAV